LQNVLVRYDVQIQGYQQKINAMKTARMQYYETGALPSPEAMGFYIAPEKPASRRTGDARAASK
ncbi:MAG TPA: hypothetical protein VFM10_11885, partial [Terriglobales bacterium]|nr:hypothetical protein [Terriglobales bacterium]